MKNKQKTREQHVTELQELRRQNAELAKNDAKQKQVARALRESVERYRLLVENIDLGVTLIDSDHNILMVNGAQGRMFNKPVEDFVGKKCYWEFEKRKEICPHCPGVLAMANGHSAEVETEGVRDDGSRFSARVQAFPIRAKDKSIAGYIEVVEDITERKRMEDYLREHFETRLEAEKKRLEAAQLAAQAARLASIGVIAAGITHEINQPLSAIQVHANTLLYLIEEKKYVLPEPFNKIFYEISEGTKRINHIIEHMRSFWLSPSAEPIEEMDLNAAVQSALSLTSRRALSHSIKLNVNLASEKIPIKANKLQVEQIVLNLVTNAIQALNKKSTSKKQILIKTETSDGQSVLTIQDNGVGLPTEKYEDLFNPFYSTKKSGEGMGLGLAIVKMFVDRFKGKIEAATNHDGGATFVVRFPLAKRK